MRKDRIPLKGGQRIMLSRIARWFGAWVKLLESLVVIFSFAYIYPQWHSMYVLRKLLKAFHPKNKQEKKNERE